MSRNWTPKSEISVTDGGIVIKVGLNGVLTSSTRITLEEDQLCVRGQHGKFGSFEIKFEIPSGYNRMMITVIVAKDVLRIDVPPGKDVAFLSAFPKSMLIYCNGCGKHFDIVIVGKGSANYSCPACGKVQIFDLEAFVNRVIEQSKNLLGKKRGRR